MPAILARWTPVAMVAAVFCLARCSASGEEETSAAGEGRAGASGSSAVSAGTGAQAGTGGATGGGEVCADGLDNDADGKVDEECPCSEGDAEVCYPAAEGPPEGCKMGTQTCTSGAWGPCVGVTMPAPGESSCCVEVGENPTFEVYDAFVAAYPASAMPNSIPELSAFMPLAGSHKMTWSQVVPGDEFCDNDIGGISQPNLEAGRAFARERAEQIIPADAVVVADKEEAPIVKVLSGEAPCNGLGWAWGSLLYQRPDFSVAEIVYLYVGYCAQLPTADAEAFFYSEEPVLVCSAPIVR